MLRREAACIYFARTGYVRASAPVVITHTHTHTHYIYMHIYIHAYILLQSVPVVITPCSLCICMFIVRCSREPRSSYSTGFLLNSTHRFPLQLDAQAPMRTLITHTHTDARRQTRAHMLQGKTHVHTQDVQSTGIQEDERIRFFFYALTSATIVHLRGCVHVCKCVCVSGCMRCWVFLGIT